MLTGLIQAIGDTIIIEGATLEAGFTMPSAIVGATGVLAPILIQFFKRNLSKRQRDILAIGLSILWGVVGVTVAGQWDTGNWIDTILACVFASMVSYRLWWKYMTRIKKLCKE